MVHALDKGSTLQIDGYAIYLAISQDRSASEAVRLARYADRWSIFHLTYV